MTPAAPSFDGSQPCAQVDPEVFFPDRGGHHKEAKDLCRSCPFVTPCLEYALQYNVLGIWGATTELERRRLRKERGITAKPLRPSEAEQMGDLVNRLFREGLTLREIGVRIGKSHGAVQQIRIRRGAA